MREFGIMLALLSLGITFANVMRWSCPKKYCPHCGAVMIDNPIVNGGEQVGSFRSCLRCALDKVD